MKKWKVLEDGGSGRWLYVRDVGPLCWVFLCVDDMVDCCGRDADCYFTAQVSVVDLLNAPLDTLRCALRTCDAESWLHELSNEDRFLAMAQCLFDHGAKAPCWEGQSPEVNKGIKDWLWKVPSDKSPTFRRLRAEARRFAEKTLIHEDKRNWLLDTRIVNRLGQTAREYAGGTEALWDSLRRIKRNRNASAEQKLVLSLYQSADQTLGVGPIPSDLKDPTR